MYIYYVIAFFAALLFFSVIKKKWAVSTYIISIYLFTLIVALFIEAIFPFYEDSKKGAIYFVSGISLFILPYLRKAPVMTGPGRNISVARLLQMSQLISLFLIALDLIILPAVIKSFSVDFADLREGERVVQANFILLFFIKLIDLFNPLSYTLLTIFFYVFTFVKCKSTTKVFIFMASLSAPWYGIMVGGRTQMIYWLLALGFNYLLFFKYLSPLKRKSLNRIGFIVVGVIIIYIAFATIGRFGSSDMGAQNSLLVYMGQPYLNFNNFIENFHGGDSYTLRRIFPLTYSLFNGMESLSAYRDLVSARSGMDIGIFYTLLGDLFVDVGVYGMFIYASVYFVIVTLILKKKTLNLSSILIVSLLFLIPLQGVFYYSFWKWQVTFCAILTILLAQYIKVPKQTEL